MMIKAVTFDLWDTIIHDDSDEPKRAARGLGTKREERRYLVWAALNRVEPIPEPTVRLAYDVADAAFNHNWHERHVTWTIGERLSILLKGLGRTLPEGAFAALVKAHEEMEIVIPPDAVPGIKEALQDLSRRYKLAIVSDAIVSPARCLRALLELHGLKEHFSGFAFSDEVGHSKPHREMFVSAAEQLGVTLQEMVHIGDRDHNDVKGPQALGMKAILFTGTRDRDRETTSADAICAKADELGPAVDQLAKKAAAEN